MFYYSAQSFASEEWEIMHSQNETTLNFLSLHEHLVQQQQMKCFIGETSAR